MRSGKLSQRIKLIKYNTVADGAGGQTATPAEILETWAQVTPIKGARAFQYGQIVQTTWYEVTLRYREDVEVTKDIEIDFNGRELVIHSVINNDFEEKVFEIVAYEKL